MRSRIQHEMALFIHNLSNSRPGLTLEEYRTHMSNPKICCLLSRSSVNEFEDGFDKALCMRIISLVGLDLD